MKFYCDACNTKYAISDEKVSGKVLKVRCKKCGNIVTVRQARAPVASSSSPSPDAPKRAAAVPSTNWYYALNGQTFGPFTVDALREKYKSASIGDATYVWHEQLGDWRPVAAVDVFKNALAIGQQIRPSKKTLGFSGPLEAVRDVDAPKGPRAGVAPDAERAPRRASPAPSPEASRKASRSSDAPSSGTKRPVKDARKEKLDKLRARLASTSEKASPDKAAAQKKPDALPGKPELPAQPSARPAARPSARPSVPDKPKPSPQTPSLAADDSSSGPRSERLPSPVGGEALMTFAQGVTPSTTSSQEIRRAESTSDAVRFERPPSPATPSMPSPSSTSDILDRIIGPEEDELEEAQGEDSGIIPFFPEGPQLEGSSSEASVHVPPGGRTSGSLLIKIDEIKKQGRGKRLLLAVVVGAVIVGLGGVATMFAIQERPQSIAEPESPVQGQKQKDDLTIKTYKKDEVARIQNTVELEDELLFDEDEGDSADDEPATEEPSAEARVAREKPAEQASAAAVPRKAKAEKASPKSGETVALKEKEKPASEEPEDIQKALLSRRAGKSSAIRRPSDPILDAAGRKTGLTKDEARRGFRRVRHSVRDCRERHNRYSAKLDAAKIKLSVTVAPSGRVSRFDIEPRSVKNTEFERCMQSHKGRWRFASFNGKEVVINTSIIMQ